MSPKHYWNIWFIRSKKYLISHPALALIRSELGYRIQVGSECDKHLGSKITLIESLIGLGWKNDSNDTLAYDDEAHKAVLFVFLMEAFELKNVTKSGKSPPGGGQKKTSKSPKFEIWTFW